MEFTGMGILGESMLMKVRAPDRVTFFHGFSSPLPLLETILSNVSRLVFQVRYAPKVSLRIRSGLGKNGRIVEGSELRFKCRAEANPPNVEYR